MSLPLSSAGTDQKGLDFDGILGMNVMRDHLVIIDIPGDIFRLSDQQDR